MHTFKEEFQFTRDHPPQSLVPLLKDCTGISYRVLPYLWSFPWVTEVDVCFDTSYILDFLALILDLLQKDA